MSGSSVDGEMGQAIVAALPFLEPAVATFELEWPPDADEGEMGYDKCGQVLGVLIAVLMYIESSTRRDELLAAAFRVLETDLDPMYGDDTLEGLSMYQPFRAHAARWASDRTQERFTYDGVPPLSPTSSGVWQTGADIIDLVGVRPLVSQELGIELDQVPGMTYFPPRAQAWPAHIPEQVRHELLREEAQQSRRDRRVRAILGVSIVAAIFAVAVVVWDQV